MEGKQRRSEEDRLGTITLTWQVGLGAGTRMVGMEVVKVSSGYILKVGPTGFAYRLNESSKRKSQQ